MPAPAAADSTVDADALFDRLQLVVDLAALEFFGAGTDAGFELAKFGFDLVTRHAAGAGLVQHAVELALGLHGGLDGFDLVFHAPELGERPASDSLGAEA